MRLIIDYLKKKEITCSVFKTFGITTSLNVTCEGVLYRVTRGLPKHYILWAFSVSDSYYHLESVRYFKNSKSILAYLNKKFKSEAKRRGSVEPPLYIEFERAQ